MTMTLRWVALAFMALAIIAAGFAPVAPETIGAYLKAAAGVCVALGGLFMHPPGSDPPPPSPQTPEKL